MKPALFVSLRKLDRAENIKSLWDAYDGPKEFAYRRSGEGIRAIRKADYHGFGAVIADDFIMPIERKRNVKTILVGHHITGGKAYGADQPDCYLTRKMAAQIDYFVSPSHDSVPIIASYSKISEEKCVVLGSPRTDMYFGKSKGDGRTGYGEKTMYLYVPTFRGNNAVGHYGPPKIDWDVVDDMLEDDEVFVLKRHTYINNTLSDGKRRKHVVEVPSKLTSNNFIIDCDVLVTDYSSIVFDGYLCGKPSVLYCPDKDDYQRRRFMYHEYPDFYSSKTAIDEEQLVSMVRKAKKDGMGEVERECLRFTADACDGHSVERIVKLIKSCCEE